MYHYFQKNLRRVDRFQQRHRLTAVCYAVIKKYSEDQGGYQAVLLTYYGFLSIFPLLLVLTTIAQWLLSGDSALRGRIIDAVTSYFPIMGQELQRNVHGFSATGLPLVIGIAVLFYGARGVADAFRHVVNTTWRVPLHERSGPWSALGRSMSIIVFGGLGFILAAVIAGYNTVAGHSWPLKLVILAVSAFVLFCTFVFIIRLSINRSISDNQIAIGASVATVGLLLLQNLGSYVAIHQLKHFDTLYGTFALVLGLLFWLYLQAQLIVYALQIDAVRGLRLWPRSLREKAKPLESTIN